MKPSITIYSCTFKNYDWTLGPLAKTPQAKFLRFGDSQRSSAGIWEHIEIPENLRKASQTLTNRYFKFFPKIADENSDVAIYVDGNILIKADLTPLVEEFLDSNADIALFPHPSGRSVKQEIDFALKHRIPEQDRERAEAQRQKYAAEGILDSLISENTILFHKSKSARLEKMASIWWTEIEAYSKRDQISLPYAIAQVPLVIHYWKWHFDDPKNPFFQRYPHKRNDFIWNLRTLAFLMKDHSFRYRLLSAALKPLGYLRRHAARISRKSR